VKFTPEFLPPPNKYRVFVPLCGKSLDLVWLYNQGHEIVGVEGFQNVVEEFYKENNIPFTTSEDKLFKSTDGRIQIHVGDLFAFSSKTLGSFDAVYDRGSLVAINISDRDRYASLIKSLLRPKFSYFLSAVEYQPTEYFSGPPCSLSLDQIKALFDDIAEPCLIAEEVDEDFKETHYLFGR